MPKVSIVLPVYNGSRYIRESIDSICEQTFVDWELIIVNDCSTDDTPQILEEYIVKDNRIHIIHNAENQKLPKSLNIGFSRARGEYLTWTSDDNRYLPMAIEAMVNFLDRNPDIYLVSAAMNSMDGSGHVLDRIYFYDEQNIYYGNSVGACFMYRQLVLRDIGGYDPTFFLVEDYEYWLRILFHYGKIGKIEDVLYLYRFHESSLTATRVTEIQKQRLRLLKKYLGNILERECQSSCICRLYYEFIEMKIDIEQFRQRFFECLPELRLDIGVDYLQPIIAFGAGNYGNRAYDKFGDQIVYYADSDSTKCGHLKNGKTILSVDEMIKLQDEYQLLICVGIDTIYEVLNMFSSVGIKACCVYQNS